MIPRLIFIQREAAASGDLEAIEAEAALAAAALEAKHATVVSNKNCDSLYRIFPWLAIPDWYPSAML